MIKMKFRKCFVLIFLFHMIASSRALTIRNTQLPIDVDTTTKVSTNIFQKNELKPFQNPRKEFLPKLLQEIGQSKPTIVYQKIYKDSPTKICWYEHIFVRENNKNNETYAWKDIEVVFESPDEKSGRTGSQINNNVDEMKIYQIEDEHEKGCYKILYFKTIEKTEEFTLRKNESFSCETGSYLSKTYSEWPQTNKRRLVLKLSSERLSTEDALDNNETFLMSETDRTIYKDNPRNQKVDSDTEEDQKLIKVDTIGNNHGEDELTTMKTEFKDANVKNQDPEVLSSANPDDLNDPHYDEMIPLMSYITSPVEEQNDVADYNNSSNVGNTNTDANPIKVNDSACSTILAQLLSGNSIISGLSNLKTDETILFKGDIMVSKKVFDKENGTDIVQPLYMIHEDTEIKLAGKRVE